MTQEQALAILKYGYNSGVTECFIDNFEIDEGIRINWEVIENALINKLSLLSLNGAIEVLNDIFDQDDPHWENSVFSVFPELQEEEDLGLLPFWSEIIKAAVIKNLSL